MAYLSLLLYWKISNTYSHCIMGACFPGVRAGVSCMLGHHMPGYARQAQCHWAASLGSTLHFDYTLHKRDCSSHPLIFSQLQSPSHLAGMWPYSAGYINMFHFSDFLAVTFAHVTKFWPVGCKGDVQYMPEIWCWSLLLLALSRWTILCSKGKSGGQNEPESPGWGMRHLHPHRSTIRTEIHDLPSQCNLICDP